MGITFTDVNFTRKAYKKPPVITEHFSSRSYAVEDKKIRLTSYFNVKDEKARLVINDYDKNNRIGAQHWYVMKNNNVQFPVPVVVRYRYSKNGSFTSYGMLEKKYTKSDTIVKFEHQYDSLGRIVKRVIYNRDFRITKSNDPREKEVFLYTYTKTGELFSMSYSRGDSGTINHFYTWKDPDANGNPKIQQVCDAAKKSCSRSNGSMNMPPKNRRHKTH